MTFFPSGEDRRSPTFGLLSKQPGRAARVSETADGWRVDADGEMSASIRRSTGEIEFIDRDGGRILATHPHHRMSFNPGSGAVSAYFVREEDDVCYGLGEKSGTLVKNARIFRFGACDAAGYESEFHDPLYKNIPFLLIGNKSRRRFGGDFHVEFEGGPMDLYVFAGTTPASVIERYTRLTGRTVLQPKFTLGYLASAFWPSEQPNAADLIVGFAKKCRELGIPCDG